MVGEEKGLHRNVSRGVSLSAGSRLVAAAADFGTDELLQKDSFGIIRLQTQHECVNPEGPSSHVLSPTLVIVL